VDGSSEGGPQQHSVDSALSLFLSLSLSLSCFPTCRPREVGLAGYAVHLGFTLCNSAAQVPYDGARTAVTDATSGLNSGGRGDAATWGRVTASFITTSPCVWMLSWARRLAFKTLVHRPALR
jgi:hypothetical protein